MSKQICEWPSRPAGEFGKKSHMCVTWGAPGTSPPHSQHHSDCCCQEQWRGGYWLPIFVKVTLAKMTIINLVAAGDYRAAADLWSPAGFADVLIFGVVSHRGSQHL